MNTIVLVNDSFRRDHLGCYGNGWIRTPNLDEFARRAAVFDQYYIASYPTVPNRWDMAVGKYGFPTHAWEPLRRGEITWAQYLAGHDVHAQMIWDTPMLGTHDYNYTRGFKGLEFVHAQKGDPWITAPSLPVQLPAQPHKIKSPASLDGYLRNHYGRQYEREFCVARTMSAAMDWLQTNYDHDSFFLYVDMWDPHEPFDAPWYDVALYADPGWDGDRNPYPQYGRFTYMSREEHAYVKALYAAQCTLVDRWVGYLLDFVERLGLMEDTLIVWTTDHGHLFGEHDLQGKPGGELGRLYEATTRIPLLVCHPEGLGAGQRIPGIVQPPDLLPSILEFMGVEAPTGVEGRSFWPLVRGDQKQLHEYAFSNRYPQSLGDQGTAFDGWVGTDRVVEPATVTSDQWAYIGVPGGQLSELYDLRTDPQQTTNVIDQHPDVAERMHRAFVDFMREHGATEERLRPFVEGQMSVTVEGELYAFRDDMGQWIAFPTEAEARRAAHQPNAPGPERHVDTVTFDQLLADNPRNLVHLFEQYYWAEELA